MITLLSTIIVISVIVFVHEFGHFAMSKLGGVRVEKFSIGFPPTLLKKTIGETVYAIGAIPFGGYVKLAGENAERADKPPLPHELSARPKWIRASIMIAGPFMNFVLAIFLFWAVIAFHGMGDVSSNAVIGGVIEGTPADSAGVIASDSIVSIDGIAIASWDQLAEYVHNKPNERIVFSLSRADEIITLPIVPAEQEFSTDSGAIKIGLIGIQPNIDFTPMGALRAVPASFALMGDVFVSMASFFKKIFTSGVSKGDIGGPILIAKMAGASAKSGWASFLFFLAALSVNLGLLNLLPLPALDGGQLLLVAIEAITRKPLSFKIRIAIQQIGFLLILALMIYVTFNDITTLFGK
ncbi:RIP metalloprotease RseP [bacterium]|nr:RIP metalloprotease RseP [bacterium]